MIINSTYHDYYDSVAKTVGVDKTLVFNRTESMILLKDFRTNISESLYERLENLRPVNTTPTKDKPRLLVMPIIFCGKVYWFQGKKSDQFEKGVNEELVYEPLDSSDPVNLGRFRWDKNAVSTTETLTYDMTDLCMQLNASIIAIAPIEAAFTQHDYFHFKDGIISYPKLKDYNFQKVVDPYTAYQEIQMFNFGVLSSNKDPEPLNDKSRIVAAGFDLKTSFRNTK